MRSRIWLLALGIYAGAIFYFSSLPAEGFPFITHPWDKIIHFGEYAILGIISFKAFSQNFSFKSLSTLYIICLAFGSLYGLSDELHQIFVPLRFFSVWDWFADIGGVSLGIALSGGKE